MSGIPNTERVSYRWYVWRPPINEDNPPKAPSSEIDLNTHLIRMRSGDYVFCNCMQDEIQVRPGELPVKRGHYNDGAEMMRLMIVVVTFRKVHVWMTCSVRFYGD